MVASNDTVTVASKMPNGVILRLFEQVDVEYPLPGGGSKTVSEWHEMVSVDRYVIKGIAAEAGKMPDADGISHGFALTYGIPKDFWDKWLEQNKSLDMVKKRLIFAHQQDASIQSFTKTNADNKSGLEPIYLNGKGQVEDYRAPKGIEKAEQ